MKPNVLLYKPEMLQPDLSEILIEIWQQALVDESNFVKLDSRQYPVVLLKAKHLRQVTLEWEGKSIIGIEQNSKTTSRWAAMARSGIKVMQFVVDGKYAANVADGKVTLYGKRVSPQEERLEVPMRPYRGTRIIARLFVTTCVGLVTTKVTTAPKYAYFSPLENRESA